MADEECIFGTNFPMWQGCLKRTVKLKSREGGTPREGDNGCMLTHLCNMGLSGNVKGEGGRDNAKEMTGACACLQVFHLVCAWGAHQLESGGTQMQWWGLSCLFLSLSARMMGDVAGKKQSVCCFRRCGHDST